MDSIWEMADRVVFERGVSLRRVDGIEWCCEAAVHRLSLSPADINVQYGLRPIIANLKSPCDGTLVFPPFAGRLLNVQVSLLHELIAKNAANYFQITRSLMFLLDALIYHSERLALHYVDTVADHIRFPHHSERDWAMAAGNEAFFEFDALVTAAIRALDSTRNLIWRAYGQNGSVPSSLRRTIKSCQRLPDSVKERVSHIWDNRLTHAKEYRDCIQHYVAVGSSSWAKLTRIDDLIWTLSLRIPDNPEVKAATKFTYDRGLDAMTYAWELVTDVIGLAVLFVETTLLDDTNRDE
jgi:hypothetical protein